MSSDEGQATTVTAEHAWMRSWWVWHLAFAVLLALSVGATLADPDASTSTRWVALAGSAVLVGWYLANGAMSKGVIDHDGDRNTTAYVVGAIAIWIVLTVAHPAFHLLLFILFFQIFAMVEIRRAVRLAVALSVAIFAVGLVQATEPGRALLPDLGVTVVGLVAAVAMAWWIDGIITESRQRHDLIGQLEATRAELVTAERQAGMLEERQRMATEIHDTLAQGFTSIAMLLEVVAADLPDSASPDLRRRLELAATTARTNLDEARRLIAALSPAPLDGADLPGALGRLGDRLTAQAGTTVEVRVEGPVRPLPAATEVAALRAVQEALANVAKHAHAGHVVVTLRFGGLDDPVAVEVVDDGVGFDHAATQNGYGLQGMRQRLEPLGGTVTVASSPGAGTTVLVLVPG